MSNLCRFVFLDASWAGLRNMYLQLAQCSMSFKKDPVRKRNSSSWLQCFSSSVSRCGCRHSISLPPSSFPGWGTWQIQWQTTSSRFHGPLCWWQLSTKVPLYQRDNSFQMFQDASKCFSHFPWGYPPHGFSQLCSAVNLSIPFSHEWTFSLFPMFPD